MKNTILIILSLVLLASCNKNDECEAIIPSDPAFNIRIVDGDGISLIGENNIYKPSEITLTRGSQTIFLLFNEYNEETYIKLYYPEIESGKDYQLKLNEQETDILNLTLKNIEGECFDFLSVEAFYINGAEVPFDSDSYSYVIQK